jgi:DNA-binding response OmpR family regulator
MPERKTILIAEDDELNLDFFELMLSKLGFRVEKASDGKTACEILRHSHIDLALVNTMLPEISGWEILKIIQNDPKLALIPVILLSDIDNIKEKVESFEQGAEDYVTKPFNFSVLLSRIRAGLRKRELLSQIQLREERINLADKTGEEIKQELDIEHGLLSDINEEATRLINEGFDEKTARAFLKKTQKQTRESLKKIENGQRRLEAAFKAGATVKTKEIELRQLERPEKINARRG